MKSKAPLALMEQLVMVLVFALAAALCLQVFVLSDQMSRRNEAQDRAVSVVQCAAETVKGVRGDFAETAEQLGGVGSETDWKMEYDADWMPVTDGEAAYWVQAVREAEDTPRLGSAVVSAHTADGESLFAVTVAWQEVDTDA